MSIDSLLAIRLPRVTARGLAAMRSAAKQCSNARQPTWWFWGWRGPEGGWMGRQHIPYNAVLLTS